MTMITYNSNRLQDKKHNRFTWKEHGWWLHKGFLDGIHIATVEYVQLTNQWKWAFIQSDRTGYSFGELAAKGIVSGLVKRGITR